MMWKCRIAVLMMVYAFLSGVAAPAENATGIVYRDANENGVRDTGERGVNGVLVSNGLDIVATDKTGRYTIPISDDTIVFLIKPRGWMTPVGPGNNIPRFYYIHKPNGSPEMKYDGVAPTGPLPASIDFPLQRQKEPNRFRVICLGDTQTRNVEEVHFFAHDLLEELKGIEAVFGITLGDNVFDDLSVFKPLVETMSSLGMPWRYVPGNHDHNHDAPTTEATDDGFERVFGPSYYAFNYGPVHFIVLNDIRHDAAKDAYHGGLGERQFTFLKNDLAHVSPKQLVVLLMHIPITELDESEALFALIKDFPHTFSLSAHTHDQAHVFVDKSRGWLQETPHHHLIHATACGSWWGGNFDEVGIPTTQMSDGGPNNYSLITFDRSEYDVEFRIPRRSPDYQMNIWLPDRIPAADTASTAVVANVFAGSRKSQVEMRVDGATAWTTMRQFTGKDPYYVKAIERQNTFLAKIAELKGVKDIDRKFTREVAREFAAVLRGLPEPSDTDHLWQANLPANLAAGAHIVTIRTTDMFGRTYSAKRVFVVYK